MEYVFNTKQEFEKFSKEFIDFAIKNKEETRAFFVTLKGDLGAGKTTFVQAVGKLLGVTQNMVSPTFVLQKFYKTPHKVFKNLIHIDAYRVEDQDEAKILSLEKIKEDSDTLVFIEWPEKIKKYIPESGCEISIEHLSPTSRRVTVKMYGKK